MHEIAEIHFANALPMMSCATAGKRHTLNSHEDKDEWIHAEDFVEKIKIIQAKKGGKPAF